MPAPTNDLVDMPAIHFSLHSGSKFYVVHIYSLGIQIGWRQRCMSVYRDYCYVPGGSPFKSFSPHRLFQITCLLAILVGLMA